MTELVPPATTPRGLLAQLADETDLPAFIENVRVVATASRDADASVVVLTQAILRDVALTSRVLRSANSIAYSRTTRSIDDVGYAVMVMGYDRVRDLALSATVLDQLQRRAPGLRPILVLALLTATSAETLARRLNYPRPEEAYLGGMFRCLGEVIIACYRPELHAELLSLAEREELSLDAAARAHLGFTLRKLAGAAGEAMRLPGRIVRSLEPPPSGGQLNQLLEVAESLTDRSFRGDPTQAFDRLRQLAEGGCHGLELSEETLHGVSAESLAATRETLAMLGIPVGALLNRHLLDESCEGLGPPAATAPPSGKPRRPRHPRGDEALDVLRGAVADLNDLAGSGHERAVEAITAALAALCQAGWERAVFGLATEDRSRVRARVSRGDPDGGLRAAFEVPVGVQAGPLGAALERGEVVLGAWEEIGRLRGDALLRKLAPRTVGLLPIVVDRLLIGCVYADHTGERIRLSPAMCMVLGELRAALGQALRVRG
jgi:hypothetical protein